MAKEINDKKEFTSCLSNETVRVKFIKRPNRNITNPKHVAYGGMLDSAEKILVPKQLRNGQYSNILNDSEKSFLEDYLNLEEGYFSIYKKDDNFWDNYKVRLTKEDTLLNLSDPYDYIKYKVLLSNDNLIAPSLDHVPHKATYLFVLVKEGEEEERKVTKLSAKKQAYKYLGKYEDDKDVLNYILRSMGKAVSKRTKISTLKLWIDDEIEKDPALFNKIIEDKYFETKVLINTAVDLGVITLVKNEYYDSESNTALAESNESADLTNTAIYLNKPRNQEVKLSIQARIDNKRE
jgi:hypothetical protein